MCVLNLNHNVLFSFKTAQNPFGVLAAWTTSHTNANFRTQEEKKIVIVHLQRSKPLSLLTHYEVATVKADWSLADKHFLFEKTFLLSVFGECQCTAGHMSEQELKGSVHNKGNRFVSLCGCNTGIVNCSSLLDFLKQDACLETGCLPGAQMIKWDTFARDILHGRTACVHHLCTWQSSWEDGLCAPSLSKVKSANFTVSVKCNPLKKNRLQIPDGSVSGPWLASGTATAGHTLNMAPINPVQQSEFGHTNDAQRISAWRWSERKNQREHRKSVCHCVLLSNTLQRLRVLK